MVDANGSDDSARTQGHAPTERMTPDAFATLWATFGFGDAPLMGVGDTLRPPREASDRTSGSAASVERALRELPAALDLERGQLLGRGGMGEVYCSVQQALGREVAVKVVLGDGGERRHQLLREAWAMGAVEHPNVVPVHQLGLDHTGAPQIVMKKISGLSLHERLIDPRRASSPAEIRSNIEVLMEVARALEFAHSRGIVHRDVKSENVMIGEYGEVYLLDWGLALGTREEHRGRLRMAADVVQPEGTPVYMAPEMINRTLGELGPLTDVYLLGGTLHEILTGRAPHRGNNLMGVISSIVLDERQPEYPPTASAELQAIAERALSYRPEDRFESVRAFRLAVAEALEHAESTALAEESASRLGRLRALTSSGLGDEDPSPVARDLFTEGVFGCDQALRTWPNNPLAKRTRAELLVTMGELELEAGQLDSAKSTLARLDEPPPQLMQRLSAALSDRAKEEAELANRRHDDDLSIAALIRVRITWGLAFLASGYSLSIALLGPDNPSLRSGGVALLGTTLLLLAVGGFVLLSRAGRGAALRNQVNRKIMLGMLVVAAGIVLTRLHGILQGESYELLATRTMLVWAVTAGVLGVGVDRRVLLASLWSLAAWIGCIVWPSQALYFTAFGYFSSFATLAIIWSRDARSDGGLEVGSE